MRSARTYKILIFLAALIMLLMVSGLSFAQETPAYEAAITASVEKVPGLGEKVELTITLKNTSAQDMTQPLTLLYPQTKEPVLSFGDNGSVLLKAGETYEKTITETYEVTNKSQKGFNYLVRSIEVQEDGTTKNKDQKLNVKVTYAGEGMRAWIDKLNETFIASGYYKMMIDGFGNTMLITVLALIIGVTIGALIAIIKYFADSVPALKPLAVICDIYTTVVRGVPMVVLLLIFYFIIMASAEGVTVAFIAFGINSGAYMAQLIRSGLNAVDKGQMEAGRSLGMSKIQTMYKIILPQAVRYILPAIGNELIALLKETSVAGYVAVVDLTRAGNLVRNNTYDAINPLLIVAVVYLVLVILLTNLLKLFERRLNKGDNR